MNNDNENLTLSTRRIKGQIDGIIRMIEEERNWIEILIQIKAATAALEKVNCCLIQNNMKLCCDKKMTRNEISQQITQIMTIFFKYN